MLDSSGKEIEGREKDAVQIGIGGKL